MNDTGPRFCSACGQALTPTPLGSPPIVRLRCGHCGRVSYRNPIVGVAVVLIEDGRILLGRRGRGAYAGSWCIPCGYVEWDEDVRAAARREAAEETGLEVEIGPVCAVHSNFHQPASHTVGIWFWARACGGVLRPGDDLDQVGYFSLDRPPPLAFPTDALVIADLRNGC